MYFCRNCGEAYQTDETVMCTRCGVSKGQGANYCCNCGKPVNTGQIVCLKCGAVNKPAAGADAKSRMTAGLLGIFFGSFGVHNFYLGYTTKAVTQLVSTMIGLLLSCIGVGVLIVMGTAIWGLAEGIMILCGKIDVDGQSHPLTD